MSERGMRKCVTGLVKSVAMDKTISVQIDRLVKHRRYHKYIRKHTVLKAHDELNQAGVGDTVEIVASRPLSKTKNWRLTRIVEIAT